MTDMDRIDRPSAEPRTGGGEPSGIVDSSKVAIGSAAHEAQHLTAEATAQVSNVVGEAKAQIDDRAWAESKRAAEALSGIGQQLRTMAERADDDGPAVRWVREAGDRTQRLADRLDQGGPQGIIDDAQRFARRQPGLFLAGAAVAGFLVGRALRHGSSAMGSGAAPARSRSVEDIDLRDREIAGGVRNTSVGGFGLETPANVVENLPTGIRPDA